MSKSVDLEFYVGENRVVLFTDAGHLPLVGDEVEINHSGVRAIYTVEKRIFVPDPHALRCKVRIILR